MSWRPDNWAELVENRCGYEGKGNIPLAEMAKLISAEIGADAMHEADVKFLEDHKVMVNLTEEGFVKVTFRFTKEEWLAFTGKEVV